MNEINPAEKLARRNAIHKPTTNKVTGNTGGRSPNRSPTVFLFLPRLRWKPRALQAVRKYVQTSLPSLKAVWKMELIRSKPRSSQIKWSRKSGKAKIGSLYRLQSPYVFEIWQSLASQKFFLPSFPQLIQSQIQCLQSRQRARLGKRLDTHPGDLIVPHIQFL